MQIIKKILKKILNEKKISYILLVQKYHRSTKSIFRTLKFMFIGIFKLYIPKSNISRGLQIENTIKRVKPKNIIKNGFVHYIDEYKIPYSNYRMIENSTIDYEMILNKSLNDFYKENSKLKNCSYKEEQLHILNSINIMIDKTIDELKRINADEKYIIYFNNIKDKKVTSLEEALQRILFYNQILWQTGHSLNGLGRLDKILYPYYKKEKNSKELITNFLLTLHSYYWFKSSSLLGDTGQIIILGGLEENENYFYNDLTYLFIDCIEDIKLPDPKILLRVSNKMPRELLERAVKCIKTGVGSPLLANDDQIIEKLISFGYDRKDSYNYVTSACWEPFIVGKSMEHNNIRTLVYMKPFLEMFENEDLEKIKNKKQLMSKYKKYLQSYTKNIIDDIKSIKFDEDPLMSLFVSDCNSRLLDVTNGGAVYNNFGVTSVSLANVINSIINIDKYVFENREYSLEEFNNIRLNNYKDNNELLLNLKEGKNRFGSDNKEIVGLVNEITNYVNEVFENNTLNNKGKIKFGISSPSYITDSINTKASFDGRRDNEPFSVHISSDIVDLSYTELINFASSIDYSNHKFNGNVIDFIVSPNIIENNFDKFVDLLKIGIEVGFYEMQINVVSSETLIMAKKYPEKYPNLIVRVWGFSAYFNDLPEKYKDVLIERALINEGKSN